jgi:hypothetical protein
MRRDCAECSPCGGRPTRRPTDGEIAEDLGEGSQSRIEGAARRPLWPGCEDRRSIGSLTTSAEIRQMSIGSVAVRTAADSSHHELSRDPQRAHSDDEWSSR